MRNALLIFLILSLPLTSAKGQSEELKTTGVSSMVDFDLTQDIALQLPTLEELSNIALEYSPKIKKNINLSQAEKEKIFLQRRTWAQHIQLFVNASSGNQGRGKENHPQSAWFTPSKVNSRKSFRVVLPGMKWNYGDRSEMHFQPSLWIT